MKATAGPSVPHSGTLVFDPRLETMPRGETEQLQLERLQALLARLKRNVRRYREQLGDASIQSLADLARLPVTRPEDLITAFPYGMFALPLREVIRLHSTVGPDGKQLVIGHTRNDLSHWGRLVARQLAAANVSNHDVIQICLEGGVFSGAAGYILGAERIEASMIPEDPIHIEYQLATLQNYRATVLITTPSNARDLVAAIEERKIDPQSLNLLTVVLSRPIPPEEREALRSGLFAEVRCGFGIPEILDPGLCVECPEGQLHVNEDQFVAEVRDGELLVTTLCREAMPLLRYATRLACELRTGRCACGRTGSILTPGPRLDGQLRVREKTLYPAQIGDVLARTKAKGHPARHRVTERGVIIALPVTQGIFSDTMRVLEDIKRSVEMEFLSRLGIPAEVQYVSPREFEKYPGCAV